MATDAVHEPLPIADRVHQPRGKSAGAQNMVHDRDRIEIRVGPADPEVAQHDGRLRQVFLDEADDRLVNLGRLRDGPGRWGPTFPGAKLLRSERTCRVLGYVSHTGQARLG